LTMKKVAIVGGSGYSGEELVRLLLQHPHVELTVVTSRQCAGKTIAQVFPKLGHHPGAKTLRFTEPNAELLAKQTEIIVLAWPDGEAGLPLRRMQRKRAAVWPSEAPAFVGNRARTLARREDDCDDPIHAASDSGQSRHPHHPLSRAGEPFCQGG